MGRFADLKRDVEATVEFHRIKSLPSRTFTPVQVETIRSGLTQALRRPGGTMELFPNQALALHEAGLYNGLAAQMGVGEGKTLTTALLPVVLNPEPSRVLLILPASLLGKTKDDFQELKKHWHISQGIHTVSYEALGRVDGATFLEQVCIPDVIIMDEAHKAKNPKAGVTRRLERYLKAHPNTRVFVLSGTLFNGSIKDGVHLVRWALKDLAPLPKHDTESDRWADALDTDAKVRGMRPNPGPLVSLAAPEDGPADQLTLARRGFRRRLQMSPGVLFTEGADVQCSLNVRGIKYDVAPVTEGHFQKLRETWHTPDDWTLMEAVEVWACAKQLSLGMHYVWSPRPPDEWRAKRKAWKAFVRETLKASRTLDTEEQVADACREGALDAGEFLAWDAIRPSYTPRTKAVWHDSRALDLCKDWLSKRGSAGGIVWTEHGFFGRELSRMTGVPYFGQEAMDGEGRKLANLARLVLNGEHKPTPIICSVNSCGTGQNLQGWRDNLVTSCVTTKWEQLLGRTHRTGQRADEVNVEVLIGCWEHRDAWDKALDLARTTRETQGSKQKLLLSTPVMPDVDGLPGARWTKTVEETTQPTTRELFESLMSADE